MALLDEIDRPPAVPANEMSVGFLTMAYGPRKYLAMAASLARSLRLHQPQVPLAIVTDSGDPEFVQLFDKVVPLNPEWGSVLLQKLSMDQYSPFARTIFIDSDCLMVRGIERFFPALLAQAAGVIGQDATKGENPWWGVDFAEFTRRHHLGWMPTFNGGIYAFTNRPESSAVFTSAREIMEAYDEYGFKHFGQKGRNEEPCMALALARHGIHAVPDDGSIMRVPQGLRGPLTIDVLRGISRLNMSEGVVEPAIVHFADVWNREPIYRREQMKLALSDRLPVSRSAVSHAVNLAFNPPYCVYAGVVRSLKRLMRRGRRPNFPVAIWP